MRYWKDLTLEAWAQLYRPTLEIFEILRRKKETSNERRKEKSHS